MKRFPAVGLGLTLMLGAALTWGVNVEAQVTEPTPAPPTTTETPPAAAPVPNPTPDPAAPPAEAEAENATLELIRKGDDGKERRIRIVRTGTTDATGIFTICSRQDDEPEDAPTLLVFSETGTGGIQIFIDKNVIRVPLALVTQKDVPEGEEGGDGRIEASAGTARFLDNPPEGKTDRLSRCAVEATPKPKQGTVRVTQGKTELTGQKLVYDESDGIARIDGPIAFSRANDDGPLTGSSQRIEVDVDDEKTILVGNVVLTSKGGRVSKAGRVEYDDAANVARLIGTPEQPAESVQNGDTLRAGVILYDLDRNEVVARKADGGTITGEFQDGEPGTGTPAATPPGVPVRPTLPVNPPQESP
ncbi:OstA family protein [Deinococcus sp. Arct2-2]|uniref:LptA/OstA family protein n=1 Tax=Deinococcus sp. Arct2-2 TaxID=2568653 RepID=UPI0010A2FBAE|nr:LptA/OstA family protein [Deinococcus sp. Arct2-2]THF68502.1 OstA family protein [Deinococcus sp. Arct2-2]